MGVCVDIMHGKGANSIHRVSLMHAESQFQSFRCSTVKSPHGVHLCVWACVRASQSEKKSVCVCVCVRVSPMDTHGSMGDTGPPRVAFHT